MTKREKVYNKFDGKCAYSGTPLENDWQIDHVKPIRRNADGTKMFTNRESIENLFPCQKLINHYKHQLSLEEFRNWYLGNLHLTLQKLPKNPRTDKSKKRNEYMRKVASYFGITETKPFSGVFYFEKIKHSKQF